MVDQCISTNSSSGGSSGSTSSQPPPLLNHHTPPAEQSPYHSHSFLSKCLSNHKRVMGLGAWLASTTAEAWCTGKHGGPEALIKTAITPLRRTCVHTLPLSLLHAKSSLGLSASGSGIHLQASLLALL